MYRASLDGKLIPIGVAKLAGAFSSWSLFHIDLDIRHRDGKAVAQHQQIDAMKTSLKSQIAR